MIHPPVDIDAFGVREGKEDFYLTASRLVPYKRVDVIVEAFRQMPDKSLVVIGDGPDMKRMQKLAGPNVRLLGHQSFDKLRDYMQCAKAFVFAAEEDFGIMPVEAMACGTPVIAFGKGGSLETVQESLSGLFFESQTAESVISAIERFETHANFAPAAVRESVECFHPRRFRENFDEVVQGAWDQFQSRRRYKRPSQTSADSTAARAVSSSKWRSGSPEHSSSQ